MIGLRNVSDADLPPQQAALKALALHHSSKMQAILQLTVSGSARELVGRSGACKL